MAKLFRYHYFRTEFSVGPTPRGDRQEKLPGGSDHSKVERVSACDLGFSTARSGDVPECCKFRASIAEEMSVRDPSRRRQFTA